MFSLAPTLVLFGATFLGEVLALDFPINLQIPEDGVLGDTFGDSNIETLLDPYTELDFTPTEELAHLQYTDNFTVELRRRVQLALELPFKEVDFETHYDENGEVEYYPVYQFDNGTTVTVKSDYLLLENGHLVHQDDVGGYYKENGENVGQGDDPALLEGRTFVHEERFIWNQALEAGRVSACGCTGLQVMLKEECVPSLEHAIENSVAGDVIILSNNNTISKPVYFGHDLALVGETCDDYGKPTLYVNFHDKYKAGLMLTNRESQTLHVSNIDAFGGKDPSRTQQSFNSFAQSQDYFAWISLQVRNCKFHNFFSAHRGSVFFVWTTGNVTIDGDSAFTYNTVADRREVFGGGAVSLGYIAEDAYVNITATFHNNAVVYPYPFGSEHGEGGAIFAEYSTGHVYIGGEFKNNFAADGGAVHIKNVESGTLTLDGHFEHNMALDTGAGCRGGALRIFNLTAPVILRGTYVDNLSDTGRGAVVALNILNRNSSVELDGEFRLNTCGTQGAVVSQTSSFFGEITYKKGCKMLGNEGYDNPKSNIMYIQRPVVQRLTHEDLVVDASGGIVEDLKFVMITA